MKQEKLHKKTLKGKLVRHSRYMLTVYCIVQHRDHDNTINITHRIMMAVVKFSSGSLRNGGFFLASAQDRVLLFPDWSQLAWLSDVRIDVHITLGTNVMAKWLTSETRSQYGLNAFPFMVTLDGFSYRRGTKLLSLVMLLSSAHSSSVDTFDVGAVAATTVLVDPPKSANPWTKLLLLILLTMAHFDTLANDVADTTVSVVRATDVEP